MSQSDTDHEPECLRGHRLQGGPVLSRDGHHARGNGAGASSLCSRGPAQICSEQ